MSTLQEVASRASVSISTVSRVLNTPAKVRAGTRTRVEEAIRELRYKPNRVARRLRSRDGRSHLLGLIIPDIQNAFFSNVVRGVEDVARAHDYAVILCNSDEELDRERFYLEILAAESADGVILPPIRGDERTARRLADLDLPVVCIDRRLTRTAIDTVVAENREGARAAISHLVRLGHRRIGAIIGPLNLSTSVERRAGYRQALEEAGIPPDDALVRSGEPRREEGRRIAEELLAEQPSVTALFAGNALLTLGVLQALRERGLNVPGDLAVVGYDDEPWAGLLDPPLTTVRQPSYEMGRHAAELLLKRIAAPGRPPALVVLEPELVVRRSCGSEGRQESATSENQA